MGCPMVLRVYSVGSWRPLFKNLSRSGGGPPGNPLESSLPDGPSFVKWEPLIHALSLSVFSPMGRAFKAESFSG